MAICGVFALVLGYLAGLRFRVMVVLPLEMAGGVVAIGLCLLGQIDAGQAGLAFLVFSVAVQVGYGLALTWPLPAHSSARGPLKA